MSWKLRACEALHFLEAALPDARASLEGGLVRAILTGRSTEDR